MFRADVFAEDLTEEGCHDGEAGADETDCCFYRCPDQRFCDCPASVGAVAQCIDSGVDSDDPSCTGEGTNQEDTNKAEFSFDRYLQIPEKKHGKNEQCEIGKSVEGAGGGV